VLALIFVAGLIAAKLIRSISRINSPEPPAYSTGSDSGSKETSRAHAAIPPGEYSGSDDYGLELERARLAQLRARLDEQGYSGVKFRLDGDTLVLYGNVPTEYDRLTVQAICLAAVGFTSLSDNLTVTGADPDD
jgi:hypothetical protein